MNANTNTPPGRKREEQISPDGKWRSFPKVPNLLQYVSNGNYYGRIKVGGKTIRERTSQLKIKLPLKLKPKSGELQAAIGKQGVTNSREVEDQSR